MLIARDQRGRPDSRSLRRGFSLLELLLVVTIIGVIASVVLPRIGKSGRVCLEYTAQLIVAAEKFFLANGKTPKVVNQLQADEYYGAEIPVCPVDGRAYRLNPTTGRVVGHHH